MQESVKIKLFHVQIKIFLAQDMQVLSPSIASVPAVPADEARKQVSLLADRIINIPISIKAKI
jgi:hypothetical protein